MEIDVWVQDGDFWLGHDKPENKIKQKFLSDRKSLLWCHAKNLPALVYLLENKFNTFSHDNDPYVFTSRGHIWAHPHSQFTSNTVAVMPEWNNYTPEQLKHCKGICSDFIDLFKNKV